MATVSTTEFVSFAQEGDVRINASYVDSAAAWIVRMQPATSRDWR